MITLRDDAQMKIKMSAEVLAAKIISSVVSLIKGNTVITSLQQNQQN